MNYFVREFMKGFKDAMRVATVTFVCISIALLAFGALSWLLG